MAATFGVCGPAPTVTVIGRPIDRVFEDAQFTGEVNLNGRKLRDYPKICDKYDLADTIHTDLSKNRLSELPPDVCQYRYMERLNCYHNFIKAIPADISQLQALTHLNLSRNQLTGIPECVCALSSLEVLLVSNNKLLSLPEQIGQLQRLMDLDVSCNEITHLPSQIGDLRSLRSLNVRRNLLVELPVEICKLNLIWVEISCNRIQKIPTVFCKLEALEYLELEHNPLESPPAHMCRRGRQHILKFLHMEAIREDRKRGFLSDTDMKRLLRKSLPNQPPSDEFRSMLEGPEGKWKRHTVLSSDSGYSTADSLDRSGFNQTELEQGMMGGGEVDDVLALKAGEAVREQRHGHNNNNSNNSNSNSNASGGGVSGVNGLGSDLGHGRSSSSSSSQLPSKGQGSSSLPTATRSVSRLPCSSGGSGGVDGGEGKSVSSVPAEENGKTASNGGCSAGNSQGNSASTVSDASSRGGSGGVGGGKSASDNDHAENGGQNAAGNLADCQESSAETSAKKSLITGKKPTASSSSPPLDSETPTSPTAPTPTPSPSESAKKERSRGVLPDLSAYPNSPLPKSQNLASSSSPSIPGADPPSSPSQDSSGLGPSSLLKGKKKKGDGDKGGEGGGEAPPRVEGVGGVLKPRTPPTTPTTPTPTPVLAQQALGVAQQHDQFARELKVQKEDYERKKKEAEQIRKAQEEKEGEERRRAARRQQQEDKNAPPSTQSKVGGEGRRTEPHTTDAGPLTKPQTHRATQHKADSATHKSEGVLRGTDSPRGGGSEGGRRKGKRRSGEEVGGEGEGMEEGLAAAVVMSIQSSASHRQEAHSTEDDPSRRPEHSSRLQGEAPLNKAARTSAAGSMTSSNSKEATSTRRIPNCQYRRTSSDTATATAAPRRGIPTVISSSRRHTDDQSHLHKNGGLEEEDSEHKPSPGSSKPGQAATSAVTASGEQSSQGAPPGRRGKGGERSQVPTPTSFRAKLGSSSGGGTEGSGRGGGGGGGGGSNSTTSSVPRGKTSQTPTSTPKISRKAQLGSTEEDALSPRQGMVRLGGDASHSTPKSRLEDPRSKASGAKSRAGGLDGESKRVATATRSGPSSVGKAGRTDQPSRLHMSSGRPSALPCKQTTARSLEDMKDSISTSTRRRPEQQREDSHLHALIRQMIESRLKVALPDQLSDALKDGVVLCHLANHIRPRSVATIHVPSPAVPKLTLAKARRNVESFLEACRKIGVDQDHMCTASDITEERGGLQKLSSTVSALVALAS